MFILKPVYSLLVGPRGHDLYPPVGPEALPSRAMMADCVTDSIQKEKAQVRTSQLVGVKSI